MKKNPFALIVLDGWGHSQKSQGNAIQLAHTPNFDKLIKKYPNTLICTHGHHVGLPADQFGNSEVGHMTLSAGRVIPQTLPLITKALDNNISHALDVITSTKVIGNIHLIGLCSSGGVHSHINHTIRMAKYLSTAYPNKKICIQAITDGRDTDTQQAIEEIKNIIQLTQNHPNVILSSISGRYYAMDRDRHWDRTYEALNMLYGLKISSSLDAIELLSENYSKNIFDEFIPPTPLKDFHPITSDDTVIITNFRADRARQICNALLNHETPITSKTHPNKVFSMTAYPSTSQEVEAIFKKELISNHLGDVFEQNALKQYRIAETEKFAHVTYFFNGGHSSKHHLEEHILIPSPKVDTYDLQPEMSCKAVTDEILTVIEKNLGDVIIANFANADMVGHTGDLQATIKAIEATDKCLGIIIQAMNKHGWSGLITADHGNAEWMLDGETKITTHTCNPVPLIAITDKDIRLKTNGSITEVAPTVLDLMKLPKPKEMTFNSLIV